MVLLFTDGAARRNPKGPSAAGYRIVQPDGQLITAKEAFLGIGTNNAAEYHAVILGLEACRPLGTRRVHCTSDSELVVNQLLGRYLVKAAALRPMHDRVKSLIREFDEVTFEHKRREHPQIAAVDLALNELLDKAERGDPNVAV